MNLLALIILGLAISIFIGLMCMMAFVLFEVWIDDTIGEFELDINPQDLEDGYIE